MKYAKFAVVAGASLLMAACASSPPPQSTISVKEMQDLLSGNVLIVHDTRWSGPNGEDARAAFHAQNGTGFGCGMDTRNKTPQSFNFKWEAIPSSGFGSAYGSTNDEHPELDRDAPLYHAVEYNKETGEWAYWARNRGQWTKYMIGHVQDSWPISMTSRCPDLMLPSDLPINEKQTSDKYVDLKNQDPSAIIKLSD